MPNNQSDRKYSNTRHISVVMPAISVLTMPLTCQPDISLPNGYRNDMHTIQTLQNSLKTR